MTITFLKLFLNCTFKDPNLAENLKEVVLYGVHGVCFFQVLVTVVTVMRVVTVVTVVTVVAVVIVLTVLTVVTVVTVVTKKCLSQFLSHFFFLFQKCDTTQKVEL